MRTFRTVLPAALLLLFGSLLGCATAGQSSGSEGDPNVITQAEIQEVGEISSAYNLIRRLHPQWLQKRGRGSISNPGDIEVYVEGSRQGPPSVLRQISVIDVESITFLPPDEATMRYGSGHDNGVIQVNLKGGS
jgi:hypothetical protein